MLEARVSDSYVMPGFGDWMPGDVTTVYDPVSHHVINEFEFPVFPGRISYDLMCMLGYDPINPYLDGGILLDIDKSTPNTTILREDFGGAGNLYIHHDRGIGRVERY